MSEAYISLAIGSRKGPLQGELGINQAAYSGYLLVPSRSPADQSQKIAQVVKRGFTQADKAI
jgi:hypothetical protein